DRAEDELSHTRARLLALSPAATLERGYAIVQREDGTVVRDSAAVGDGERLRVRLATGRLGVTVDERDGSCGPRRTVGGFQSYRGCSPRTRGGADGGRDGRAQRDRQGGPAVVRAGAG